jgi:hypothetical protein
VNATLARVSITLRRNADVVALVAIPFAVYLSSMRWYPDGWDAGEMQTVPYILGITHPTGFPLFVLAGWVFSHAVPISTVAWRMNLFCALAITASTLCVRALAIGFGANRYLASLAAFAFSLTGAVWLVAVHADVHALTLAFTLGSLVALQRALTANSARALTVSAALTGCALAVHLNAIFIAPFVLVGAIVIRRELRPLDWLRGVGAFVVPLLSYLYLPLRSQMVIDQHLDPNWDLPLPYTFGADWGQFPVNTWAGFVRMITGASVAQHYASAAVNPLHWPGYAVDWLTRVHAEVSLVAVVLALLGVLALAMRRPLMLVVVAAGFASVPFAIAYVPNESDVFRYLLPSFAMTMAVAAAAPHLVKTRRVAQAATFAFAAIFAFIAVSDYATHHAVRAYTITRGYQDAIDIVHDHTPDGAIVFSSWLDLTALGYGKYIDNSLGSRRLVGGWPSDLLPTFRGLTPKYRVYVLADVIIGPNLAQYIPNAWQHEVGTWSQRRLVEIVPRP